MSAKCASTVGTEIPSREVLWIFISFRRETKCDVEDFPTNNRANISHRWKMETHRRCFKKFVVRPRVFVERLKLTLIISRVSQQPGHIALLSSLFRLFRAHSGISKLQHCRDITSAVTVYAACRMSRTTVLVKKVWEDPGRLNTRRKTLYRYFRRR